MTNQHFSSASVSQLLTQLQSSEKGLQPDIAAEKMKAQAKFVVPFASHIPGQGKAEAIGALVLAAIRGK